MEFFTIAFSTFLGAAVALAAQRLAAAQDASRREEAALNNLILDLAAKRAFLVADDWHWTQDEVDRVVGSVKHARDLIREARLASRPRSAALPHLQQMTRSCNMFLELSERVDRERLKGALRQLAAELSREVDGLHRGDPRYILSDAPGSLAL
ncbi:hypothetical protein EUA93_04665 [Nocardioides oleivorans]|uniref:Uncharacterized protein n=1 Tax=Nocardioides oleivorans TaxID=273676 RepID=A0A4Q2RWW6_9ACTN|nr:hypothetical protein [Nocardioides oleivorans]RYB93710.1 hypothetical protein EUA93_04665 [Nocardioides oleivorans]